MALNLEDRDPDTEHMPVTFMLYVVGMSSDCEKTWSDCRQILPIGVGTRGQCNTARRPHDATLRKSRATSALSRCGLLFRCKLPLFAGRKSSETGTIGSNGHTGICPFADRWQLKTMGCSARKSRRILGRR
jgi:hypothetical protein